GPGMAMVAAALRRRGADLPLRQAGPGLDDGPPAPAGGGRPLELAARAGLLAALVGPAAGPRPAATLGTPAAAGAAHPPARPSRRRGTFAPLGHPGPAPGTPRKVARPTPRRAPRAPDALSGRPTHPATRRLTLRPQLPTPSPGFHPIRGAICLSELKLIETRS